MYTLNRKARPKNPTLSSARPHIAQIRAGYPRDGLVLFENRRGNNRAMTRSLAILRNKDGNIYVEVKTRLVLLTAEGMPALQNTYQQIKREASFSKVPKSFRTQKAVYCSKISNIMSSKLFYAHILPYKKFQAYVSLCL